MAQLTVKLGSERPTQTPMRGSTSEPAWDGWAQSRARQASSRGGFGGGDGSGGVGGPSPPGMPGGGGGAPGGSSPPSRHRPQFGSVWQPKAPVDLNKLFDDKMAASDKFSYGGGDGAAGERWRKTIRGYWIAKCPVLQPLLDWAELFEQIEITPEAIQLMLMDEQYMIEAHSIDVHGLSQVIWG